MRLLSLFSCCLLLFAISCQSPTETEPASGQASIDAPEDSKPEVMEKGGIKLWPLEDSPEFMDAELTVMNDPGEDQENGMTRFEFGVKNYELMEQTPDAEGKCCANSAKGQHIHLILNNAPYLARYEASFEEELEEGYYVALAFLSRSYHESIKNNTAFKLFDFTVGEAEDGNAALDAPHMFYSRPKGTYTGNDCEMVILDFYLVNADLSEDGYNVRATINGNSFMLSEWVPYVIEGLAEGENTIKLEFLDADGNLVDSPFNPVERTVTMKKEA